MCFDSKKSSATASAMRRNRVQSGTGRRNVSVSADGINGELDEVNEVCGSAATALSKSANWSSSILGKSRKVGAIFLAIADTGEE